MAIKAVECI